MPAVRVTLRLTALAAALVTILAVCAAAAHAARKPSPAHWLWTHTHAPPSALVGVDCHEQPQFGELCKLTVELGPGRRACFWVALAWQRRHWQATGYEAIPYAHCARLRMVRGGTRALRN